MPLRSAVCVMFVVGLPSFLLSQAPLAAPGLRIPNGNLPYALDHYSGQAELVPIHHSTVEVNNHKGANVAGALASSVFYKPKMTVEVAGAHARSVLHDAQPSFFMRVMVDPDGGGETPASEATVFAVVKAMPDKDRRVFAQVRFTQLTGNAKRNDGVVETRTEQLPGGWLKLTPVAPLAPSEYAVKPIPKAQNTFSSVVFDFRLDPAAENAKDAVKAEE